MTLFFEMIKKSEEEINEMFNSGMFNSLTVGYAKIALSRMELDKAALQDFEKQMKYVFDEYTAKEARKAYSEL